MSRPPRRSHARLAMTPPASDSRDHAGRSRARAAVPAPSGRFGVVPCVATTRQRSRATRARHLFAWECPSSGTADRNPARTHLRDPKGPHPSVTKPEGHFHFSRALTLSWPISAESSPHRAMPAFLSKPLIWNSRGIWGRKIGNGNRQNLAQVAKLSLLGR